MTNSLTGDVITLFEAQAARTPAATAVVCGTASLTFARLNVLVDRLAQALSAAGIGPEQCVAVALARSEWSVVAALAVWKAGAVYVPLDPSYPSERVGFMLRDVAPSVVLTAGCPPPAVAESGLPLISVPEAAVGRGRESDGAPPTGSVERDGRHAAYVIYTSGSTGRPKGVTVERRALANLACHLSPSSATFARAARDIGDRPLRLSLSASWAFDASLAPLIWMAHGNELHVLEDAIRMDPKALIAYLRRHAIDHLDVTPTQAGWLLRHGLAAIFAERPLLLVLGGEPVPELLWRELAKLPGVTAFNVFGPTEGTVETTVAPVGGDAVTIGRPIRGTGVRVLDDRLEPVPVGMSGELYLTGHGLARGYAGQPAETAERFVADPFGPPGARMYRTGDLVGETSEGNLLFVGRADEQVKIRGFRVEPGEIEAVLGEVPGLGQAAVVAIPGTDHELRLVCFAVPAGSANATVLVPQRLRAHLAKRLPRFMVPQEYVIRADLPRTPNGKLDRAALRLTAPQADGSSVHKNGGGGAAAVALGDRGVREDVIRALFAEVLGLEEVAATDRFYELGGDSIVSMQLAVRARATGLVIEPEQIFQRQTPAALAVVTTPIGVELGMSGGDEDGPFPLTPIMRWLVELGEHISCYRQSVSFRTPVGLRRADAVALVDHLLQRHGVLRMRLDRGAGGTPSTAGIMTAAAVTANEVVTAVDITGLDRIAAAALIAQHESHNGDQLDPYTGQMVRATWFDAGPQEHGQLLLTVHHLATDGVSWRIIQRELMEAVHLKVVAPTVVGTWPTVTFRQWARLLAKEAVSAGRERELDFWIRTLGDRDPLLTVRALHPSLDTAATARKLTIGLPTATTMSLLTSVPATLRLQVNEALLSALGVAVAHWRKQWRGVVSETVLFDVEGHGRELLAATLDLSATVGWFTSVFPVRLDVGPVDWDDLAAGGNDWLPVLRRCREWLRAIPDRGVGYGLLRHMNPHTTPVLARYTPPQICMNYLGRIGAATDVDWNPVTEPDTGFGLLLDGADGAMPLTHAITIDAVTRDDRDGPRLDATITWAGNLLAEAEVRALAEVWLEALSAIVRLAGKLSARELTPGDVPLVVLSQADIELIRTAWETIR